MLEISRPISETPQLPLGFEFKDFSQDKLSGLTDWQVMELEPGRRWFFTQRGLNKRGPNEEIFLFEVFKTTQPIEGTTHQNRVSLLIQKPAITIQAHLLEIESFSIGTTGIGLPGESAVVKFFRKNNGSIEIRNDGLFFSNNLTEITIVPLG